MSNPLFTVFTPTYNRAHTLPKVYESLKKQTSKDFEWLIVDDGSSDATEEMVKAWQDENHINIRFYSQENQGKHVAFNRGVLEAHGELFLTLDSDDTCISSAIERFAYHWNSISIFDRVFFSGVTCLCMNPAGQVVGTKFPTDIIDANPIIFLSNVTGDKWGFHRTSILREFPFPKFPGEKFIPEGVVWNRVGEKYKIRFINEPLRVIEYLEDGLTFSIISVRAKNPNGVRLYYKEYLNHNVSLLSKMKAMINYLRFSYHAEMLASEALIEIRKYWLGIPLLPIGYYFYFIDCLKLGRRRNINI